METTTTPPGAHPAMSSEEYHGGPGIGSGGLKKLSISPLHYWAAYRDPERESSDKPAFAFGRAWHCALFEPMRFETDFVVLPEGLDRRTKEGKALYAELTEGGREVLSAADAATVGKMVALARKHPVSQVVFEKYAMQGAAEVSLFTTDPATGVLCKIRPDYMLVPCEDFPNGLIIDGKSCTDASPAGFARDVWNFDYGLQAAYYTAVFARVYGTAGRPAFLWLAQEKAAPFAPAYYAAGADLIEHWDRRIAQLLPLFAQCERSNIWPGYATSVGALEMPAWAQKQMEAA